MSPIEKLIYPARVALWRTRSVLGLSVPSWPLTVEVSHHIDASGPDPEGFHDYHYEYDVFEFTDGFATLLARAYSDEPEKAALMVWSKGPNNHLLAKRDLHHPLFIQAAAYLRKTGKSRLDWRDRNSRAYVPLNDCEGVGPGVEHQP
ncbi:hypothetical protein DUT91_19130 [Phyllobacterium salinisoli]|uniref:Uncharacterized protein n=2 Tax=Phyllobacterium salinisoli TaxID=1899321 RepID=A0A368JY95_9HYPH|nr:hypothetical protein DUT91_19130 [Phyllobacterium salinisoli]